MLSGESSDFFLRGRLLRSRALCAGNPATILDFGCGVGSAAPVLAELFASAAITGADVSRASLEVARSHHGQYADFVAPDALAPGQFQLAYCNGVFHHIPVPQRAAAMASVAMALAPGGALAFWENNPWSPAARWVMSRIPFDRDAVMLWPRQARQLIRAAGLVVEGTEFHFIWPRLLAFLRPTEALFRHIPAGAQYLVWARKPG